MTQAHIEGPDHPQIYGIIADIKRSVGALAPVQKDGVPFPFRGIDGVVNHLNAAVNAAGVVTVPNVVESEVTPREVGNRVVKTAHVRVAFTFYAPDGSSVTATTAGLADDFADRSVAQAQSVAFRIALLQTFFLPTQSPEPEQTGQAVQDYDPGNEKPQPKAVAAATKNANKGAVPAANANIAKIREDIKVAVAAAKDASGVEPSYVKIGTRLSNGKATWANDAKILTATLKAIEAGEIE